MGRKVVKLRPVLFAVEVKNSSSGFLFNLQTFLSSIQAETCYFNKRNGPTKGSPSTLNAKHSLAFLPLSVDYQLLQFSMPLKKPLMA